MTIRFFYTNFHKLSMNFFMNNLFKNNNYDLIYG